MSRILILLAALAVQPALAIFGIETDPDKIEAQWVKEKLEAVANGRDPKERAAAAEWLGGRKTPEAIAALGAALADRDARVRQAAASGLWKSEKASEPARTQLIAALDDADPNVVAQAAGALASLGMKEDALAGARKRVFDSPDASLSSRFLVSRNLVGREPAAALVEPMIAYLERSSLASGNFTRHNIELAQEALKKIAKTQDRSLVAPLMEGARSVKAGQPILLETLRAFEPRPDGYTAFVLEFLDSPDPKVRHAALGSLRPLTKEKEVSVWAPRASAMLRDPDVSVRNEALWALGRGAGLAADEIDKVVAALGDSDASVRRSAARAIGEMGDRNQAVPAATKARVAQAGLPMLAAAMEGDADADVRSEAKSALAKLGASGAAVAASPKTQVAAAAPSTGGSESGGMAVLRARKVTFEESSFFRALSQVDVELVRAFLDAGMSPTKSVVEMGPPIRAMLFASQACQPAERPTKAETKAAVKLLLERGADPNASDANGNTALMEAASHGCDREVTRMLIKAGAKVDAKNKMGLTPFEMGLFHGHDGLEEIIAAGYRLPAEKAKMYAQGYAGKPQVQAMIRKASGK
ncbi:MAG: HEAT repeat domain-containing protein [Usitatibacter sp.]